MENNNILNTSPEVVDKETENIEEKKTNNTENEKGGVFSRSEYSKKDFWNERFQKHKSPFDWYLEYKELKYYFEEVFPLKKTDRILMVGCGNAKLSEEMFDDGYSEIINIDISDEVVKQMSELAIKKNKKMTFLEMDATKMSFETEYFDIIIDKGTLDALICGKDYSITDKLLIECMRVLKKNGKFLIITHGSPEGRRYIFERSIGFENYSYYVCKQILSETAQLINIMRSNLVDKPLNHIMKDKAALLKTMIEFMKLKKQKKEKPKAQKILFLEEDQSDLNTNSEDYVVKINKKKLQVSKDGEEEKKEDDSEKEKENEEKIQLNQNNEENEKNLDKEKEENEKNTNTNTQTKEEKETIYNPIRQSFCYVYQILKKSEL